MKQTTRFNLTVRYAETDAQGVVHHSNYLVWFEEGRSDFLRQSGLNYTDFETAGFFIVVAEAQTRYRAPAYYEDLLTIETTLEQIRGKILKFSYRVLRGEESLAEGRTTHIVLNAERRPTVLPPELMAELVATEM
jgi:acyl-CoA thioester hydrolase